MRKCSTRRSWFRDLPNESRRRYYFSVANEGIRYHSQLTPAQRDAYRQCSHRQLVEALTASFSQRYRHWNYTREQIETRYQRRERVELINEMVAFGLTG